MKRWFVIWLSISGLVILLALVATEVFSLPIDESVRSWIEKAGIVGMVSVVAILSLDLFLPVPSSLVVILSGAAFGGFEGGLLAFAGLMIGNVIGFELMRHYGLERSRKYVGAADFERARQLFSRFGPVAIIVTRPIPVLMETLSLTAGLVGMSRAPFLVASLVGSLPVCFIYAFAGAWSVEFENIIPALAVGTLLPACAWLLLQFRSRDSTPQVGEKGPAGARAGLKSTLN